MNNNSRKGWQKFSCECGKVWEWPTRDRFSPSSENCPECFDAVHPEGCEADESLPADKWGNLLVPWDMDRAEYDKSKTNKTFQNESVA